jgi:hypothetical protein
VLVTVMLMLMTVWMCWWWRWCWWQCNGSFRWGVGVLRSRDD